MLTKTQKLILRKLYIASLTVAACIPCYILGARTFPASLIDDNVIYLAMIAIVQLLLGGVMIVVIGLTAALVERAIVLLWSACLSLGEYIFPE